MTTTLLSRRAWRALAFSLFLAAPLAHADDPRDPPTRAGRVVNVIGDAWLFDHETREWVRLERNQTIGEGDRVRTDERARVALRVGSTSLWVDERSDLELTQLDEGQTLLNIDRGDVAVRLRTAESAAETRLHTREGTVQAETVGLYRVEQLDRGTKAYNWQGRLRFDWQQAQSAAPVWLEANEQAEFWWPRGPRTERSRLYGDPFGDWVWAESRNEGDVNVPRYVSAEMTGAEDLDRHGRWESAPDYGTVWIPTVVTPGWAPYRYGHWTWTRHWGWAWVDDAPWGFAPFHYGRWVLWRDRWCWSPGTYVARPVYAPALVGWIGAPVAPGVSVGVNISIGSRPPPPRYGWYPLAPRDVYVPGYQHSPRYDHRINDRPDWRNARDPITVQRPHQYRDAPSAISYLPQQGHAIQALPAKPDPSWRAAQPLVGAPARGDLAGVLPVRSTPPREAEPQRVSPPQGWRSEGWQGRRERAPEPPAAVAAPVAPTAVVTPQPQPQTRFPGQVQEGVVTRPDAHVPLQRDRLERAERPDRQERQERQERPERDGPQNVGNYSVPAPVTAAPPPAATESARRELPWRQAPQPVPQAAPQPAPQMAPVSPPPQQAELPHRATIPERAQMRAPEPAAQPQPQPQPQRQVEVPRTQPQPQPQPQPQAQPQPQRQQRDEGPQRRRGDRKDNER